jgi:hypothetical protein
MTNSRRWLVIASLGALAVALASYCLDYQTHEAYRARNELLEPRRGNPSFAPSPVVLKFGEATIAPGSVARVAVSGLYPRGNLTSNEAAIGGLLVPIVLLVTAGYFALGGSRTRRAPRAPRGAQSDEQASVERADQDAMGATAAAESRSGATAPDDKDRLAMVVSIGMVVLPALLVFDMPSMMLLNRLRLPK